MQITWTANFGFIVELINVVLKFKKKGMENK
jgi:hypothetical protein